jgi:hypothetical protein
MGGARHSARRSTLTVDPKLRQSILDTEQLLKDDEPTSHVLMGDEITTPSFLTVWTGGPSHSLPGLHEPSALSSMTD